MLKYFTINNIIIFFLLVASYFSIFLALGSETIMLWDEGTYAVNAYEMYLNGNYLVKYYDGVPEMFATNPPLVCWLQTLCFKIIGPGEVAVRLPSAFAAVGVILLIIRYTLKEKLGIEVAVYAVLILITSQGYISYHVTRTGDLDSVLIFFITGSVIYFYKFIEYEDQKLKYLVVFCVFVLLGYFAKGIACMLVMPAFLIYTIIKRKLLYVLKTKQIYYFIILILASIVLYYYFRELKTPGYVSFMLKSEFGRWVTEGKEHVHPFNFYFLEMFEKDFKYFLFFVPAFILLYFFLPKDNIYRQKSTIWLISAVVFLLVISVSKTKLPWYEAPVYPMLSVFIALGFKALFNYVSYPGITKYVTYVVFVLAMFTAPYITIIRDNLTTDIDWHDIRFGTALKNYNHKKNVPKKLEMLVTGYNGHALFYKMLYNNKYGYNITIRDVAGNLTMEPGKVYLFTHPAILDYLKANFDYELYMDYAGGYAVKTLNFKKNDPT